MPQHIEGHKELSPAVRDIIIGMSDGLTVPFAIAAGLASAAADSSTIIIAAVLSEIAAGSISMGLGGYLATQTEAEHYYNERRREEWEVEHKPEVERQEVRDFLEEFGLTRQESEPVVQSLATRRKDWIDFMMRFELGLEEPDKRLALKSAATIGGAYALGGFFPLAPYFFLRHDVEGAFLVSIILTLIALIVLGYLRGRLVSDKPLRSMVQTVLVGAAAATAAFLLAKLVS